MQVKGIKRGILTGIVVTLKNARFIYVLTLKNAPKHVHLKNFLRNFYPLTCGNVAGERHNSTLFGVSA